MKGPGVLKGYWGSPEATADAVTADGWLRTGDLVRRGVMGTATFAGRKKDVFMHGGYSVYAREVEHALEEHPDVHEAGRRSCPTRPGARSPSPASPGQRRAVARRAGCVGRRAFGVLQGAAAGAVRGRPAPDRDHEGQKRELIALFD